MNKHAVLPLLGLFVGFALLLAACGGTTGSAREGGESHFLRGCYTEGCGEGLECLAGICTRACELGRDSCTELAPQATCSDARSNAGEPAVCMVACTDSAECARVGATASCVLGFCQGQPLPQPLDDATRGAACEVSTGLVAGGYSCAMNGINVRCLDDPTDACDAASASNCPGRCQETQPQHICSGLGMAGPCPSELTCVSGASTGPSDDVSGQCQSPETVGACQDDPNACPDGLTCANNGNCMALSADCWSTVTCADAAPACPPGYALSRDRVADADVCFGACVAVQRCGCTTNAQCPAPAVCDGASCVVVLSP